MRNFATLCLCAGLISGTGPALAARLPDFNPSFPIENQTQARLNPDPAPPYAMSYTDEAAQTLGVSNGRADLFDSGRSDDAFVPSVRGGVDHGGAMLRLQWHPGE